jgi:biopolymer transport protein ExbD
VLIIFMVTATAIVEKSILVKLPDAASGDPNPETLSLGLTLLEDGRLLLDGEDTTPEALRATVKAAVDSKQDVVCLIAADEMVAHGRVVWLMDLVKGEGVTAFAINIDPATMLPPDPAEVGKGRSEPVPVGLQTPNSP